MPQIPESNGLDIIAGPNDIGPSGAVRITRTADGLQMSVDGGAPEAIGAGGGGGSGTFKARVLAASNITLSGEQTIDSVAVVSGDTVLVNGQTDATENGLYAASASAWERSTTFAEASQMIAGVLVSVTEGTLYADSVWMFSTTGDITVGDTDLAFVSVGPSFGPDTRVSLPNSSLTLVQALRLLLTLPADTPGSESSVWTIKMILAGAITDAVILNANVVQLPPGIYFRTDTDTGFQWQGTGNFAIYCNNTQIATWSSAGLTLNPTAAAQLSWGSGHGGVAYSSANGRTIIQPSTTQGNVELGLSGAALATNATHGFASIPSCAGTPTGAPTSTTGAVPLVVDSTNNKLYGYYGAAWHDLTGS